MKFEIREIDAWNSPDGWDWNQSFHVGEFSTSAASPKCERQAFTRALKRLSGVAFKKNRTRIDDDGYILEIQDRKTGEPLFAAIPMEV